MLKSSEEFADFKTRWQAGESLPLHQELSAEMETPVSCFLKLAGSDPNAFLLESVEGGASRGRYSFVGVRPDLIWRCHNQGKSNRVEVKNLDENNQGDWREVDTPALDSLRQQISGIRITLPDHLPPMSVGLVGYLGYGTVRWVEEIPDQKPDQLNLPDGLFVRPTVILVIDTVTDQMTLVTPAWNNGESAEAAFEQARARLEWAISRLDRSLPPFPARYNPAKQSDISIPDMIEQSRTMLPEAYCQMVERAKEYILAGDIFQVVLSQRFSFPYEGEPFDFYRELRRTNPAPFLFYLRFEGFSVAGSSPEILVRLRDNTITIRPIAGTAARGATYQEDRLLEQTLLADPKERAEHLMLLDLARNDVGRAAEIGSVDVTAQYEIERYSRVMHIASHVEGKLRADLDALDALLAGFPAGTVSGAPKVRAMEIIDELEPLRRGIYSGCVGYFGADGSMDSCIALRTAILSEGKIHIQAGAGVVADSDPVGEQKECEKKASALFAALIRALDTQGQDS